MSQQLSIVNFLKKKALSNNGGGETDCPVSKKSRPASCTTQTREAEAEPCTTQTREAEAEPCNSSTSHGRHSLFY